MAEKFKKIIAAIFGFVAVCLIAHAEVDQERLEKLQASINAISQENVDRQVGGSNPVYPRRPEGHPQAWIITADLLYWTADLGGIEIGAKAKTDAGLVLDRAQLHDITFEWSPGFRLGLGGVVGRDHWNLSLEYTRYTNNSTGRIHADENHFVAPIWAPASVNGNIILIGEAASKGTGKWDLNYQILDGEIGRNYFVSHALSVRPFIGMRGAWITQKVRYHYEGRDFAPGHRVGPVTTRGKCDFLAGGVRGGFDLGWHLGSQWSFFSNASASLVYGEFEVDMRMFTKRINATRLSNGHIDGNVTTVRPNVELIGGFKWEHFLCKDRCYLSFSAGYEFVQWFQMNQLIRFYAPGVINGIAGRPRGDLGLQGLTITGCFEF